MSLVVLDDLSLMLGGHSIVSDLSLQIAERDRVGLIGPNGSGKTTLLRLITGEQSPDAGRVVKRKGLRIGYLPQDVSVTSEARLIDFVVLSVPGRASLTEQLESAEATLQDPALQNDEAAMLECAELVADLHEQVAHFDAHYSEHQAKRIIGGLGFGASDHSRPMSEFSGGWKMRAVLASLLFQRPDLLLLDEPTNHLDLPSVGWLSSFLKRYDRGFVLISHDREFLNAQIERVLSFEPEGVRNYRGNYDQYLKQRAEERVLLLNRAKNLERERQHLEQFIERFRAKASKAAQVQSRVRALEKMETVELHQDRQVMSFRFPQCQRAGKEALSTSQLSKAYDDLVVLKDVDLLVQRGDRIALIGVNGAGKTTLLKILAGEIPASGGSFAFGHNTKVGYYAQHHTELLDATRTVYEEVASCAKDAGTTQIRAVLGAMLFGQDEIDKRIGVLSGGERARVSLARLMIDPGNVLLMDEPTNHLDLQSSEQLAEALGTFDGTLLFVSHNLSFIRTLANKIWIVSDTKVQTFPGTLDDYLWSCADRGDAAVGLVEEGRPTKKRSRSEQKARRREQAQQRAARNKTLGPLKKRAQELEQTIAALESAQQDRNEQLSDPDIYENDDKRDPIIKAFEQADAELQVATDAWMEVQAKIEALDTEAS